MKKTIFLFLIFFNSFYTNSVSQNIAPKFGGEYITHKSGTCLSESDRQTIKKEIEKSIKILKSKGLLSESKSNAAVSFDWPLQASSSFPWNNYFAVSNLVDHDPSSGFEDYNCGVRTYNGHSGVDIYSWPFPWYMTENDYVEIIAAEAGTIVNKIDGNTDDECTLAGNWNAVYIQHADGSTAWYGHMKKNSLTSKPVGATVAKGEFLGNIASSGWSTGPHLHFEVYDASGNLIDPYAGTCNLLNSDSWWAAQPAYREPTLSAALTHDAPPVLGCPASNEHPNFQNNFAPGETVYTAFYYQDQLSGTVSDMKIRQPDNTIWRSWSHTSPDTYSSSFWYWTWNLPSSGPFGTWTLEISYEGDVYSHDFTYEKPVCPCIIWNPVGQQKGGQ